MSFETESEKLTFLFAIFKKPNCNISFNGNFSQGIPNYGKIISCNNDIRYYRNKKR